MVDHSVVPLWYLERALNLHGLPEKITIDKSGANTATIHSVNLKFLPQKSEFPLSNSRNCGSAFCLHFDLIDQVESAFLLCRGRSGDLESRCVGGSVGRATGVAHDG